MYLCIYDKTIVCNTDILHSIAYILLFDLVVIKTSYWKIEETFQVKKKIKKCQNSRKLWTNQSFFEKTLSNFF